MQFGGSNLVNCGVASWTALLRASNVSVKTCDESLNESDPLDSADVVLDSGLSFSMTL